MLFAQPGTIGPMRLKNRIVMGPMGTNYGTSDGLSTERDVRYYAERARGGVAMIVTEAMAASERGRNHHKSLCAYHDKFIPSVAGIAEAIHKHDTFAVAQLNHRGGLLRRSVLNMEPVGPSAWINPNTGDPVRELRLDEIEKIQHDFLSAAKRLWRAGFDGVQIHAANGYLFQQFFSERINKRTDAYGGTLENRMRMLVETARLIRTEAPDIPLLVRLSATEYAQGGYTQDEIVALALALEREGVCAIDLSGGTNESPELSRFCIQPPSMPRRCLEPFGFAFKKALAIPLILAGRIINAEDAQAVLASGSCDFVSIGRGMLADPYWAKKALGHISTPIRECISCNVCIERLTREQDVACVQNPFCGTEFEALEFAEPQAAGRPPAADKKRVLVLGAGVGGVEAARVLAARGHEVEVWEQTDAPGGQMRLALAAPHKEEVAAVWSYRWEQLVALGVRVRTAMNPTADAIRAFAPDVVFVATGGRPRIPGLFVGDTPRALTAWEVLDFPDRVTDGSTVTIVGGGMVGVETAEILSLRGCAVTIVEMLPVVAGDMPRNNRIDITLRLKDNGVTSITHAKVERRDGATLHVSVRGEVVALPIGDVLVLATGVEPNRDVVPALEAAGVEYVMIGDCSTPGDFLSVIRDATLSAYALEFEPAYSTLAHT